MLKAVTHSACIEIEKVSRFIRDTKVIKVISAWW
jgi:hypothetical protein